MLSWGFDLAQTARGFRGDFVGTLPYYTLVALAVLTSYFQIKRSMARNPQAAQANPQTQMMMRLMPLMSLFFCLTIPAGVVVYYVVSNLFRIAQQEAMYKWDPSLAAHARKMAEEIERDAEAAVAAAPKRSLLSSLRSSVSPGDETASAARTNGKSTGGRGSARATNGSSRGAAPAVDKAVASGRVTPRTGAPPGRSNNKKRKKKKAR